MEAQKIKYKQALLKKPNYLKKYLLNSRLPRISI